MKMKKIFAVMAATAVSAASFAAFSMTSASAADVVAVAGLRGQAGTYNYWNSSSNSGNVTAKDANIDGNAQYEAVWDITGDGTGSIEFLILEFQGPDGGDFTADVYPDLGLAVDAVYVDGKEYSFTQNDNAINLKYYEGNGRVRAYLTDTWNINAGGTLGLAADQAVTSQVKVVFTVTGLYNDGTSNVTDNTNTDTTDSTESTTSSNNNNSSSDTTESTTAADNSNGNTTTAADNSSSDSKTTTKSDSSSSNNSNNSNNSSNNSSSKTSSSNSTKTETSADTGDAGVGIAAGALILAGTVALAARRKK